MSKYEYTHTSRLMKRIEENYEDFKRTTLKLDSGSIFKLAPKIAAVEDVYFFMTTHDWADKHESDYLLKMENPLLFLADEWEENSDDRGREFGKMITELTDNDDYMSFSTADKLRNKYGDDMPLNTACLLELVEMGKSFCGDYDDEDDEDFYFDDEDDDDY